MICSQYVRIYLIDAGTGSRQYAKIIRIVQENREYKKWWELKEEVRHLQAEKWQLEEKLKCEQKKGVEIKEEVRQCQAEKCQLEEELKCEQKKGVEMHGKVTDKYHELVGSFNEQSRLLQALKTELGQTQGSCKHYRESVQSAHSRSYELKSRLRTLRAETEKEAENYKSQAKKMTEEIESLETQVILVLQHACDHSKLKGIVRVLKFLFGMLSAFTPGTVWAVGPVL